MGLDQIFTWPDETDLELRKCHKLHGILHDAELVPSMLDMNLCEVEIATEDFRALHERLRGYAEEQDYSIFGKDELCSFFKAIEKKEYVFWSDEENSDPKYWIDPDFDFDAHYPSGEKIIYWIWW